MAPVPPKRRRSFLTTPTTAQPSASRTFKAKNATNKSGSNASNNSRPRGRKALTDKTNTGNVSRQNGKRTRKKSLEQPRALPSASQSSSDEPVAAVTNSSTSSFNSEEVEGKASTSSESRASNSATNVRVAVRVRPANASESAQRLLVETIDEKMLLFDPKDDFQGFNATSAGRQHRDLNKRERRNQAFVYDAVFGPDANNVDVFERTTKDLVEVLFNGYNASVFVYGQTGSGKTHTMLGSKEDNGLTFLTAKHLFDTMASVQSKLQCELAVSYLEVYNENLFDLINPGQQLVVRDDGNSSVSIQGLSMHPPKDPDDLLRLLRFGNGNRTQHPTDANAESSRSHAVFQVYLKQRSRSVDATLKVSKLSMIDLAGSERGSVTHQRGSTRISEGKNINKSLLALGNCINALAEGSKFINYRDSKLTRILKDSIGGNCQTVMIATVAPCSGSYENTFNTLKFAERAKKIKTRLKQNVVNLNMNVAHFSKLVESLKRELAETKQQLFAKEQENEELKKTRCSEEMKEEMEAMRNDLLNKIRENKELQFQLEEEKKNNESQRAATERATLARTTKREHDDQNTIDKEADRNRVLEHISPKKRLKLSEASGVEQSSETRPISENASEEVLALLRKKEKLYVEYHAKDVLLKESRVKRQYSQRIVDRTRLLESQDNDRLLRKIQHLKAEEKRRKAQVLSIRGQLEAIDTELKSHTEGCNFKEGDHLRILDLQLGERTLLHLFSLAWKEQCRTEDIIKEALKQLRSKQMLLDSYETYASERDNYDALVKLVRCGNVQFPSDRIESTNEDTPQAALGDFFAPVLQDAASANDSVVNEPHGLDETFVVSDVKTEANEVDNDSSPQVKWRPPTPPKKKNIDSDSPPDQCDVHLSDQ